MLPSSNMVVNVLFVASEEAFLLLLLLPISSMQSDARAIFHRKGEECLFKKMAATLVLEVCVCV